LSGLLAKKAERRAGVAKKLLTPMQASALDSRNPVMIRQIAAMCRRNGYDLPSKERVNLRDLDAAFKKAGTELDERFRIKGALASLNLI
jgi:hypothetical protein